MKNQSTNQPLPKPPINVTVGHQEYAHYSTQEIPEYSDNPLIEALPPLWSIEEVSEKMAYFPPFQTEQRNLRLELRQHLLENCREFYLPLARHIELHYSISNMIRRSYIQRNPLQWGYWNQINQKIEKLKDHLGKPLPKPSLRSKARGFAMVGIGGSGKTTSVENNLALYPQVILHSRYKDSDLILKQLVWLKLDCPQDGSIKGLCIEFFQTVDEILGTGYAENYGNKRHTVDVMLLDMARVVAINSLGVLVIDEIQDLSEAKSGGAAHLLNFLVHLENRIGVPFILIGTPKALPLFEGEFRQARRASEQGDFFWERLKLETKPDSGIPDPDWDQLVRTMWEYQYVQKPTILPDNILKDNAVIALYHASQGIISVALTLFFLTQKRAILSGSEMITSDVVRSVVRDNQNLIHSMMNAIRLGAAPEIFSASDLEPPGVLSRKKLELALNLSESKPDMNIDESSGESTTVQSSKARLDKNIHRKHVSTPKSALKTIQHDNSTGFSNTGEKNLDLPVREATEFLSK